MLITQRAFDNYFIQAQRIRRIVKEDFDRVFAFSNPLVANQGPFKPDGVDVLISPVSMTTAPLLSDIAKHKSSLDAYVNDAFTVPASMAGIPAISIPVDTRSSNDGLPNSIQVIAQFGDEESLFDMAALIEAL